MAKRKREIEGVQGILIDPLNRRVGEIRFPAPIANWMLMAHLGAEDVDHFPMTKAGEYVVVDALHDRHSNLWSHAEDDTPIEGPGIITGYDPNRSTYSDTNLSVAEVRRAIRWWRPDDGGPAPLPAPAPAPAPRAAS